MTESKIWEQRVAAWRASGQSAVEYCAGRDFTVAVLRYRARHARPEPTAVALTAPPRMRLARLVRSRPVAAAAGGAVLIEVGAARVAVTAGFDRATLAAVLAVLASGAGDRR